MPLKHVAETCVKRYYHVLRSSPLSCSLVNISRTHDSTTVTLVLKSYMKTVKNDEFLLSFILMNIHDDDDRLFTYNLKKNIKMLIYRPRCALRNNVTVIRCEDLSFAILKMYNDNKVKQNGYITHLR